MEYELDEEGYYKIVVRSNLPVVVEEDGAIIRYQPKYFPSKEALDLFHKLKEYEKDAENATGITPGGNPYVADRRTLQIADPGIRAYKFNGSTATKPEPFSKYPVIDELREKIYYDTGVCPNFCLYNAYTPTAKLGWHSDSEKDMVPDSIISSLSFGDVRRFRVRRKKDHSIVEEFYLESGSYISMEGVCQKTMDHCVWDITKKELGDIKYNLRINLTFRTLKSE